MMTIALPPVLRPDAQKLKRIVEGVGSASLPLDRYEDGQVGLQNATLPRFQGLFSGTVTYDPSTRQLQKVDLKCQLGSFATIRYKFTLVEGRPRYERIMTQEFNERSQFLSLDDNGEEWDYTERLDNHGPFQPDYNEESRPMGPPVGAKSAGSSS